MIDYKNIKTYNNSYCFKYFTSGLSKKHITGKDLIGKSKENTASMRLAKSYNNTEYVYYNNSYIKLNSYIKILRKNRLKYTIKDYKIDVINKDKSITTLNIIISNKIKNTYTKKDYALSKKVYNY